MKRQHARVPSVPQDQPQEEATAWQIIQRIISVFTRSPFPIVIAPLRYAPKKKIIILASSSLLSSITAWQGEEGGVGRDAGASSHSPPVNLKSRSPAPALNTGISCLLALPIASLLIFLACVYSLDKHCNCDVVYRLLCTHHNPGKTR